MDSKEVALREIRELILINGSYDVYLVAQIDKILDRAIPPIGVKANASSSKEVAKLRTEWKEAHALSLTYQALAGEAMNEYMAAVDKEADDDLRRT